MWSLPSGANFTTSSCANARGCVTGSRLSAERGMAAGSSILNWESVAARQESSASCSRAQFSRENNPNIFLSSPSAWESMKPSKHRRRHTKNCHPRWFVPGMLISDNRTGSAASTSPRGSSVAESCREVDPVVPVCLLIGTSSSANSSIVGRPSEGDPAFCAGLYRHGVGGARKFAGIGTGIGGARSGPETAA